MKYSQLKGKLTRNLELKKHSRLATNLRSEAKRRLLEKARPLKLMNQYFLLARKNKAKVRPVPSSRRLPEERSARRSRGLMMRG
jgi:hypothetical protein